MNDLISIIIPVYNTQDYVVTALESVNKQKYHNYEAIIINDGSTDDSPNKILDYIKDKPKFIYYSQKNGGLSNARNKGLKEAHGEYICFLDSEDMLSPNFLEYIVKAVKEFNVQTACCNTCSNEGDFFSNQVYKTKFINYDDMIHAYLLDEKICKERVCGKLFHQSLFEDIQFEEGRIHEDTFIQYHLLEKTKGYVFVDFDGYNVVKRPNSITREKVYSIKHYDKVIATREIFDYYKDTEFAKLAFNKYFGTLLYFTLKIKKSDSNLTKKCCEELYEECNKNRKLLASKFIPFYILIKLRLYALLPNM